MKKFWLYLTGKITHELPFKFHPWLKGPVSKIIADLSTEVMDDTITSTQGFAP